MPNSAICLNWVHGFVYRCSKPDQYAAYSCWITRYALWLPLPFLTPGFYNAQKMTSKQSLLHCLIYSQVYMVLLEPISYRFMSPVCLSTKERVFFPPIPFLPSPGRQNPEYFSLSPHARSYLQTLFYNASLLGKDKNCKNWSQTMLVQRSHDCYSVFITFLQRKNGSLWYVFWSYNFWCCICMLSCLDGSYLIL